MHFGESVSGAGNSVSALAERIERHLDPLYQLTQDSRSGDAIADEFEALLVSVQRVCVREV